MIEVTNVGPSPSLFTRSGFENGQIGLRAVFDTFGIGAGIPSRVERISD